jgi:glucose-6-phosphate dehydrogenase assembly protein OpcA
MNLNPVLDEITERSAARGEVSVATMTIALFFEDESVGALARDRIHTLAAKHPSRVIVFDATRDESLQQVETPDWIELGVAHSTAETLRYALDALRLPEAPIVLLWVASGIGEDARFTLLAHNVQTIVYNSSLIDFGVGAMCEFIAYATEHPELSLTDVAYMRLAPWQESVATFFDSKEARDDLFDLRRVEIECGSEPEAYYLLGWLASRLEWTACGPNEMCNRFGTFIEFSIQRAGDPRRIRRITLSSSQSQFVAQVAADNAETILLSVSGLKSHPERYSPIVDTGIAALVERAILWGRNDQVFHDSLVAAGEILSRRKD